MPSLLKKSLPFGWNNVHSVSWFPGDTNLNHPPRHWIEIVWRYLGKHFTSSKALQNLEGLPLIPLNMSQTPVTLTQLSRPSNVVVKRLNWECIDEPLSEVLKTIGVLVIDDCPGFLSQHPAVLGTYVNPPSIKGVLKAMVVCSSTMETFPKNIREMSAKEKQILRCFVANARLEYVGNEEHNLLCSLPLFQTNFTTFVSKNEGLCAAPRDPLPIQPLQQLIDISDDASEILARLLKVRILKPTELLCEVVFPDIQQDKYTEAQVDILMSHVFRHFAHVIHTDANFKGHLQEISFVPKKTVRVRALDVFDPRSENLQRLFSHEDVFPVGELYNDRAVLSILEALGMKKDNKIKAKDLYQSAKEVIRLHPVPFAEQKSSAILQYLSSYPKQLQELVNRRNLGALLKDIAWVSPLQQRPWNFPSTLSWFETEKGRERHFFKPTEIKSQQLANLIGSVRPVVKVEPSNEICTYFGWKNKADVGDVVKHLQNVVACYTEDEKPYYMVAVEEMYSFLSLVNQEALSMVFESTKISKWVWNGNGFSSPCEMLPSETSVDLAPYILALPSEMSKFKNLFHRFGMRYESDPVLLLEVLEMIKLKHDSRNSRCTSSEVKRDIKLSVEILNELATEQLSSEVETRILFPIHVEQDSYAQLEPATRCMYCEQEEWLTRDGDDENMEYFYLHHYISSTTAERLGVPSLTNRMLDPDDLFIGEEFGQEERLTTRLNRLLEDYTDGFAVPKELIQNADDAGATEVRFLYDERSNKNAMTCLIDEGMKGCQGPALWVYNDATFKDEDFVNITRLNEATKAEDTEKIGRFGLGFNAVYNLTDVPMFVSKNYLAIFDPHTSYLGKGIKNKRRPGMKINLNKDVGKLRKFKNQFQPFNGIFGCDLHLEKEDNSFDGTLFRFPLRTKQQAIASEIKQLYYDDQQMRELLQMFIHGAKHLLLFTQNVMQVGIYHLPNLEYQDTHPALLFEVKKSAPRGRILRELSFSFTVPPNALNFSQEKLTFLKQSNFLQAASKVKKLSQARKIDPTKFPVSSMIIDVNCSLTRDGVDFFNVHMPQGTVHWLVVSSMGTGKAMTVAKKDPTLLPAAGVAVQMEPREENTLFPLPVVKRVAEQNLNGNIFCYLPLPIHSGLSVHINGAFAVASNRRSLQERVEDDKTWFGVDWNCVLMQDSLVSAFLDLLEDVKSVAPKDGSYIFHSLWPKACQVQHNCWPLLTSFYTKLAGGGYSLFSDGKEWVDITQVVFIDPQFRNEHRIGEAANSVLKMCGRRKGLVIDLPCDVMHSFKVCGLEEEINARSYSKIEFFRDIFFPDIATLPSNLRDVLTLHALDVNRAEFCKLMKLHACIPASPAGENLMLPSQLVHPNKEAASLFNPEDGRFPFGNEESYLNGQRLAILEQLGMASNDLSWLEVAERAESIHILNAFDSSAALGRVQALLSFMEKKTKAERSHGPDFCERILKANFIPVLKKPSNFPLPWKGDEFEDNALITPEEAYPTEIKYLVCCTEPLTGIFISEPLRRLLHLEMKTVTLKHVMQQLVNAFSARVDCLSSSQFKELDQVCLAAYAILQRCLHVHGSSILEPLREKCFILVGRRFLSAQQVALTLTADCSPYLFKLPQRLTDAFSPLMREAGVKEAFDVQDFISSLNEVKKTFGEHALDEETLKVATNLTRLLGEAVESNGPSQAEGNWGTVYLPDSKRVMRPVSELCIRNCSWLPDEEGIHFVNDGIPWPTSIQLGVKTRREEALRRHVVGIAFGQHEKLTNRLKRILTGYPCEKEILKELLQNADDAQATEICFIKDPRHHPSKKVFEDSWKPLQGPALCVYNNKPFTIADIEGIRNLGEGSKGEDPNKTGQYGVGFNAVYHLTDVPSFMTKGEDIGDVLCAFDPHCQYVPEATVQEPGVMLQDIPALRKTFPDVFACYLENHFPIDNGTMFRFPLRTPQMSKVSKISPSPVTLAMLNTMMEDLKKELFEVLLFVNNVTKITLCEVNGQSGELINVYTVKTTMSKEDEAKRQAFTEYIRQIGEKTKEREDYLSTQIPVENVSYVLNIEDNLGNKEKWLIVQQIGFEKTVKESITKAFKRHELGMLPRGGVACLLEKTSHDPNETRKKAFCFLPLPFETNLPVHINGHFALDHEARRNLWRDEGGGYRTDWNSALLAEVVASCYLTLLVEVRSFLQLPNASPSIVACTEDEMLRRISAFERFFPLEPPADPYWKTLIDSLYQKLDNMGLKILPVVRSKPTDATRKGFNSPTMVEVSWLPPNGNGRDQAFFNNLETTGPFTTLTQRDVDEKLKMLRKRFEEIVLKSGFNLVACTMQLCEAFQRSRVPVCIISPASVIEFYKSITSQAPLCTIGAIPCSVDETSFKDALGTILVLLYCKGLQDFADQLPGLPLLLTQDKCLQLFSSRKPKFLSRFQDILPGSPQLFIHEDVYRKLFTDSVFQKSTVLKPLDAQGFAGNLPKTIQQSFYGNADLVEWSPQQKSIPNQRWISRVWTFLSELTKDTLNDSKATEESKTVRIKDALGPLANWSILPATEVKTVKEKTWLPSFLSSRVVQPVVNYLVPLCQASCVVDYASSGHANQNLVDVLRKLGLPEVNYAPLEGASPNAGFLIRLLVSSLSIPKSLLTSLAQKIEMDPRSPGRLEEADCRVILEYFSRNVRSLQPVDKSRLKKLPFYLATHGGFIDLDQHSKVCVLPIGIPRAEIDVLERALGTVFLESWSSLSSLFSFLDLKCISTVDVYCTHILPNLKEFSANAREVHLEYTRKGILSNITTTEDEEKRLLDCLRNVPVIPSADGTLKTASSFYDPRVDVFWAMLPPTDFPPEPFNSLDWLPFLRTIGLVHEVSQDLFNGFARKVAHEAATEPTADTRKKSQVLVKHLIKRPNVVTEGLLPAVCDIPFVAGEPIRKPLRDLCQPYQAKEDGSFFAFRGAVPIDSAELVWTRAHLLPKWADPTCQRHQLGCQSRSRINQYCNDFIAQLQIMSTPSVDLVLEHCRTICTSLENKRERESSSHQQNVTREEVMERIYAFLQGNATENNEAKLQVLSNTPCILVEQGKRFIFPTQAVLELYEHLEIKPYLYSVPREFGKFHHLFQRIGCAKSVTISHYAMVLERLSNKCKNVKLHPEEVRTCVRAVQGLFEKLEENTNDTEKLSRLYLPGISPRGSSSDEGLSLTPVTLHISSNLIFNDEPPAILNRLQKFNHHFLDLKAMQVVCRSTLINFRELVVKLPSALRPIMLSSVVNERLSDVHCIVNYEAVESLQQRVSSPQFFSGIVRLIRDENCQNGDFDEKVFTSIKSELQSMEICAVGNLKTTLFCDGDPIPESEAEVPSFLDKRKTPGEAMYKVYINVSTALGENANAVTSLLSCVIVELYGQLLGKRSGLVFQMLNCPLHEIWPLLDSLKVRQDDSYSATEIHIFPKLGTFIPLEDHHLLNDAFEEFEPGEYVGYELEDPTLELEEGVATYIYARIVEEVTDQRQPLVAKKYVVNIGDNQVIEVDAADLYKFHRLDATTSAAVVVSDHQRQNSATRPVGPPKSRDKQAAFDEVSDLLEDAWKMPEEKKRKVIKRLFLRWHPDKNVGDEEFCTEIFKHVQNEILRLERGEPRGSQPTTNVDATGSHHSSYNDHFNTWGNRARQHHSQREGYRRRQHFHRDFTGRQNPQPGEAKRWFKQAKADVAAVENDIICSKPSYEWACFKCHQVWPEYISIVEPISLQ